MADDPAKQKSSKDPYPGCVKRELNYRERLIILVAVGDDLGNKAGLNELDRAQKIRVLLNAEGVDDYFDATDSDFRASIEKYLKALRAHESDQVANPHPGKKPFRSPAVLRGKSATFQIPSKLDAFIIDTLKKAKIEPQHAEFVGELAEKFGIKLEE